jgi:hypothetical protein
MLAIED